MTIQVGSPSYVAPEVLHGKYTETVDLWSAGVIMYILLSGEPPFHGDSPSQIMRKVRDGNYAMDQTGWRYISASGRDLVAALMTPDPQARISLADAMAHRWWEDAAVQLQPLPHSVVTRLREYEAENQLKRRAISVIAKGMQNNPEFSGLKEAFEEFDPDGDGVVTLEELGWGLKSLGVLMNADDIDSITAEIDQDGDGRVSFDEFLAAVAEREHFTQKERLRLAFDYFDMDHNGKIDEGELFEIVGNMDDTQQVLQQFDTDGDGAIDFEGELRRAVWIAVVVVCFVAPCVVFAPSGPRK